jgi:hypothetical protein
METLFGLCAHPTTRLKVWLFNYDMVSSPGGPFIRLHEFITYEPSVATIVKVGGTESTKRPLQSTWV